MQFVLYDKSDKTKIYGLDREAGFLKRKEYQKNTLTWEEATEYCKNYAEFACGLYITPPLVFIDLDGVIDSQGHIHPKAQEILGCLDQGCFVEYSLSKKGIHIIFKGDFTRKPLDHLLDTDFWGDNTVKKPSIEVYGNKRYCALTFNIVPGFSSDLLTLPTLSVESIPYTAPFLKVQRESSANANRVESQEFIVNGSRHNLLVSLNRALYRPEMSLDEFTAVLLEEGKKRMPEADFSPFLEKRNIEIISLYESCKTNWVAPQVLARDKLELLEESPEIPRELEGDDSVRDLDLKKRSKYSYKLHPNKVAQDFIEKQRCFTKTGRKFTVWNGDVWAVDEEPAYLASCVEKFIFKESHNWDVVTTGKGESKQQQIRLVACLKTRDLIEVVDHIKRQCVIRQSINPKPNSWFDSERAKEFRYVIAVKNGLLSIKDGKIISPFTVEFYNTGILSCDWNENAECPRFLQGLRTMFSDTEEAILDNIDCLQLWFGYLFLVGYSEKKLCVLLGDSNSGKSTLLRVMEMLVGEQYYKALSLKELDGTRTDAGVGFDSNFLGGFDEFPFDKRLSGITDMIKMYTGDTKIAQRGLYKESQSVEMTMRLVLTSNTQPSFFSDPMGGLMNRLLIWNCKAVPKEEQDPNYLRYLREHELAGILKWAVVGSQRILNGERLKQAGGESGELHQQFRDSTWDFLAQWVEVTFEEDYDSHVLNRTMYEKLIRDRSFNHTKFLSLFKWLDDKGVHRQKTLITHIRNAIRNTVFPNVRKYDTGGEKGFYGIRVRKDPYDELMRGR